MVCSIDATQYHGSESVRCHQCLTKHKDNPDKPTIYQHFALQAALMHPDQKQVVPMMAEPIRNTDGSKKQDCEINAAKRLIPQLRKQFPRMRLIITGDDLFSRPAHDRMHTGAQLSFLLRGQIHQPWLPDGMAQCL